MSIEKFIDWLKEIVWKRFPKATITRRVTESPKLKGGYTRKTFSVTITITENVPNND